MTTLTVETTDDGIFRARWTGLTETAPNDEGAAVRVPYGARCVQVEGTFGENGKIVLQGSLDGASWHTLTDAGGSALEFTQGGIAAITEPAIWIRPKVTAGSDVLLSVTFSALPRA